MIYLYNLIRDILKMHWARLFEDTPGFRFEENLSLNVPLRKLSKIWTIRTLE